MPYLASLGPDGSVKSMKLLFFSSFAISFCLLSRKEIVPLFLFYRSLFAKKEGKILLKHFLGVSLILFSQFLLQAYVLSSLVNMYLL